MSTDSCISLLICDLDGTLIDSHSGIAQALQHVCSASGIAPRLAIDRSLAGPPLDELLRTVTGVDDETELNHLIALFVSYYDRDACLASTPFEGINEMLEALRGAGHTLAIATNKRMRPTRRIIQKLGWIDFFAAVEAVDSRHARRTKAAMLIDITRDTGSTNSNTLYIGDTAGDFVAACEAGVRFILAGWGYSGQLNAPGLPTASSPSEVLSHIASTPEKRLEIPPPL